MSRLPKLITLTRSIVVALAVGSAAIAAGPAQAAPLKVEFYFGSGGGGVSIGGGRYCLSDRQAAVLLHWHGYDKIHFFDRRGRIVAARAKWHRDDYRVWVDVCRARIVDAQLIQHSYMFDEGFTGGGARFLDGGY